MAASMAYMEEAIEKLMLFYNWNRMIIVRTSSIECDVSLNGINEALSKTNIVITSTLYVNFSNADAVQNALFQIKTSARSKFENISI